MSKEYVCDSCKEIITSPHNVKMKEFYVGCAFELGGVLPSFDKRKAKIHLCDKCFLGLRKIAEKTVQELDGCEYCNALTEEDINGFFLPTTDPDCEYAMVTIKFCPMCGRKLPQPPKGK